MVLVSIIIPVYNVENYIHECIDSVLNQGYGNLEIILVDDGSTDRSGEICDEYALKDKRITVYHKKNGGLSDARNYGIERCNGEYIYLLDSDDFIEKRTIEGMLYYADKYDADMVVGGVCKIDEEGKLLEIEDGMVEGIIEGKRIKEYFYNSYSNRIQMITAWNKLYRLSKLRGVLHYPVGKIHEDEYVAHHLWSEVRKVVMLSKPLYFYRVRKDSIMRKNNGIIHPDAIEALYGRLKYVSKCENEYVDRTFDRYAFALSNVLQNIKIEQYRPYAIRIEKLYKEYRKGCIRIALVLRAPLKKIAAILLAISPKLYEFIQK